MNEKQQILLETHMDNIIRRCEKLTKSLTHLSMFIMALALVYIVLLLVINYPHIEGFLSFINAETVLIAVGMILASLFIIFRIHACMNECEMIKFQLGCRGDLDDAASTIKGTKCTQNLEVDTLRQIFTPLK